VTTTETITLPPLAEAMTARDLVAHEVALRKSLGPSADVYFSLNGDGAVVSLYPAGMISSAPGYSSKWIYQPTWPEAIDAARAWIASHGAVHRDNRIRAMALAIIDLTDQHGRCDRSMLARRNFTVAELDDLTAAACQRAGELAGNAPFRVEN